MSTLIASALVAAGCGSEEELKPVEPTTFKVRLEKVAPFTRLKSPLR